MAFEQKPNMGALFKNDNKVDDTHSDYNGSINVDGVDYWLNAWLKKSASGKTYMSLSVKPKRQEAKREEPKTPMQGIQGMDSDIPF